MAYQSFTHQIWWVMVCYDLAHQIRCAKHTFSGQCDITPMVCCSFGGHSTPQFLQCILQTDHPALKKPKMMDNSNPWLQQLSITMQRFNFEVRYKPGPKNNNVDGLLWQDFPDQVLCKERGGVRDSSAVDWLTWQGTCLLQKILNSGLVFCDH